MTFLAIYIGGALGRFLWVLWDRAEREQDDALTWASAGGAALAWPVSWVLPAMRTARRWQRERERLRSLERRRVT